MSRFISTFYFYMNHASPICTEIEFNKNIVIDGLSDYHLYPDANSSWLIEIGITAILEQRSANTVPTIYLRFPSKNNSTSHCNATCRYTRLYTNVLKRLRLLHLTREIYTSNRRVWNNVLHIGCSIKLDVNVISRRQKILYYCRFYINERSVLRLNIQCLDNTVNLTLCGLETNPTIHSLHTKR